MLLLIVSCKSKKKAIPFPEESTEFLPSSLEPLAFSEAKKINWQSTKMEGAATPFVRNINFDKLTAKPFYPESFAPLKKPAEQTKFKFNELTDTLVNFNTISSQNIRIQSSKIEPAVEVVAGMPKLKKTATIGLFEFGEDQGLPGTLTLTMMEDRQGILWIATNKGLSSFDGERIKIYSFIEGIFTGAIAGVSQLLEDEQGRIWIKTDLQGCYILDHKVGIVHHFDFPLEGFLLNNDYEMIMDRQGVIWSGTINNGLYLIDPTSKTFKHLPDLKSNTNAKSILEDSEDKIWIGSRDGLSIIDKNSGKIRFLKKRDGLMSNNVTALFMDADQQIWVATDAKGVSILNTANGTIHTISEAQGIEGVVNHMVQDDAKNIWMATDNGVYIYDISNKSIRHLSTKNGLDDDAVKTIYKDNTGQIWISTFKGMTILDANGLMPGFLAKEDGLTGTDIWSFLQDDQAKIWIGSREGIDLYDPEKQRIKSVVTELKLTKGGNISYYLKKSAKGEIVILSAGYGIGILDPVNKMLRTYTADQGLQNRFPASFIVDHSGKIWTGGFSSSGIVINDFASNSFVHLGKEEGIVGNIIWELFEDEDGQIWAASDSAVHIINPKDKTLKYLMQDGGIRNANVSGFLRDDENNMWIGSRDGLMIMDQKNSTLRTIELENGISHSSIYTLTKNNGKIYAGTGNGLTVFTPKPIKTTGERDRFNWTMRTYGKDQGLIYTDFNAGSVIAVKNKIWWGIEDKALTITQTETDDTNGPNCFITGIAISDKLRNFTDNKWIKQHLAATDTLWNPKRDSFLTVNRLDDDNNWLQKNDIRWDSLESYYNLPSNLVLPYNQNYLQFQFTAADFSNRDKRRYSYILEGHDSAWSSIIKTPHSENYRELPSGLYTFKVKSMDANGRWSEPADFSFRILKPWWARWWAILLYLLSFMALVWGIVQYRSRYLKRENRILEEKVSHRTSQLKKSIEDLKETQSQLIQSEKMASLGELTAGIAHEIQNPLNFVNNFSEVNKELLLEMKEELEGGNISEAKSLANDVIDNEDKILFHGKRADSIVKGMLQHSRSSNGIKELTDINNLCDEYLRLAYHGLRAKDKNMTLGKKAFNASMKTDFDKSLVKIHIMPQDIGRVVLNLITNAFYSVNERKQKAQEISEPNDYQPTVSVSTKNYDDKVEIRVSDNGEGIPQKNVDKIFQPFFTTKPTGQGTGLGLSLSYDVVKAHGGEIKVETKVGEGTEFIIILPK